MQEKIRKIYIKSFNFKHKEKYKKNYSGDFEFLNYYQDNKHTMITNEIYDLSSDIYKILKDIDLSLKNSSNKLFVIKTCLFIGKILMLKTDESYFHSLYSFKEIFMDIKYITNRICNVEKSMQNFIIKDCSNKNTDYEHLLKFSDFLNIEKYINFGEKIEIFL